MSVILSRQQPGGLPDYSVPGLEVPSRIRQQGCGRSEGRCLTGSPGGVYTARMWRTLLLLSLVASPTAAGLSAAQSPDEQAIRTVVGSYVNARELQDPAAIEALFTADADQHTTAGEWRRGRSEVIRGSLASSKQNPGNRRITVETVRFITPDVAIADGPYEITAEGSVRQMWTTIVLEREHGAWRIAAIRNMVPTTGPAASPR
jgi:uncharacterized protein (TIGR02246 family)